MQGKILKSKIIPLVYPTKGIRKYAFKFLNTKVAFFILQIGFLLNLILMCSHYEGASSELIDSMRKISFVLTIAYSFETIVKIISFGLRGYFRTFWNLFESSVTIVFIVDYIIDKYVDESLLLEFPVFKFLKALRVLGIARLLRQFQGFKTIYRYEYIISSSLFLFY